MLRAAALLLLIGASAAIAASAPVAVEQVPVDVQLRQARSDATVATAEQQRLEQAAAGARDDASRLHARQLAASQAIAAAEAQITAADIQARVADAQLNLQRHRLAREQAPVSALLGALVLTARRPPLLALADSASVDEMVKLRLLVAATAPVIRARTAALTRELQHGAEFERAAIAARDDLRRNRQLLDQRRSQFAGLEQRALALAKRRGSEALGAGDVALVRQDQLANVQDTAPSRREAMKIAQELASLGPTPLGSAAPAGKPPLTYRLPAEAAVVDGLGEVSDSGIRSRGVLLATGKGAALVAPAAGTILFAGPFRDYDGVIIIDHGGGWKSVIINGATTLPRGARVGIGDRLGIALGPIEVQLQHDGEAVSPALIAGSSAVLSNRSKGG
jgi:septal ring factor EnvC (AmiA/AmiB activator)